MFYDGGFFMGGMHFLWWIFWIALIGVIGIGAQWVAWRTGDPFLRALDRLIEVDQVDQPVLGFQETVGGQTGQGQASDCGAGSG